MVSPLSSLRSPMRYCWCGGWSGRWARAAGADSSTAAATTSATPRCIGVLLVRGRHPSGDAALQTARHHGHRVRAEPVDDGDEEVELERLDLSVVDDLGGLRQV